MLAVLDIVKVSHLRLKIHVQIATFTFIYKKYYKAQHSSLT